MFFAVANTVMRRVGGAIAPVISFIWNLNTNNWEAETRDWDNS